jgi:hypothetical protein
MLATWPRFPEGFGSFTALRTADGTREVTSANEWALASPLQAAQRLTPHAYLCDSSIPSSCFSSHSNVRTNDAWLLSLGAALIAFNATLRSLPPEIGIAAPVTRRNRQATRLGRVGPNAAQVAPTFSRQDRIGVRRFYFATHRTAPCGSKTYDRNGPFRARNGDAPLSAPQRQCRRIRSPLAGNRDSPELHSGQCHL